MHESGAYYEIGWNYTVTILVTRWRRSWRYPKNWENPSRS
jgi:hypothetical protein